MVASSIRLPRALRLGAGAVDTIPELLTEVGSRRPLIVTDTFLVGTGLIDRIVDALTGAGFEAAVFSGVVPDPTTESLVPGVEAVHAHAADALIGIGGGSPIDTAKALAVLGATGEKMTEFKAPRVYAGPALPVIAVPTTAGSGSEATQFTIITDSVSDEKMLCIGPAFLPTAAVVDYELTLSMPARLTADTGIDALTHAVEAYVSRKANPFSDELALSAIRAISANLRPAYEDGSNREAREAMMLASTRAGMAFSNSSVALVHGMSRPIGAHFHVAHGLSNAMLFPAVTAFSIPGSPKRYADCARAYGIADERTPDSVAAFALVDALERLCRAVGVPTPRDYGIDPTRWEELVPLMARQAVASGSPANNPLVPSVDQIEQLYRKVFD